MHDEYEISSQTIKDIMNKIPPDKWKYALTDALDLLAQVADVLSVIEATGQTIDPSLDVSDIAQLKDTIKWVDDGKHENKIIFSDEENNKVVEIKFGGKE